MVQYICINTDRGQDCLEFLKMSQGPSKTWRFNRMNSTSNPRTDETFRHQPAVDSAGHGLYYIHHSAHGLVI